jgi:RNA polymerase sigma factor (sigma-70 family)
VPEIDVALFVNTQAYLAFQLERLAPDAVLTLAWKRFYATWSNTIRGLVRRWQANPAESEDVVQEVWSEIVTRLPEFHWNANRPGLRRWLYKLVKSKTMDTFRRRQRRPAQSLPAVESAQPIDVCDARLDAELEQGWRRELVRAALEDLRPQTNPCSFAVIHLQLVEGRKPAEVAAQLGLTLEQVRYRRKRMLRKLRGLVRLYTGQHLPHNLARKS